MMRKSILFTALATLMIVSCKPKSESTKLYWCYYDPIEDKVESVLKKMTLDEKIGQMLQLNLPQVGHTERNGKFVVDDDKLEEVIGKYKVGSLLNTPQTVPPTPQEWAVIVKKIPHIQAAAPCSLRTSIWLPHSTAVPHAGLPR